MWSATSSPYHYEQNEFRLAYSRACCTVGLLLVLAGVVLDYSLYPNYFSHLATARIVASLSMFLVWLVLHSTYGLRWVGSLTLLWLSIPQIMINWMIWATEGVDSIYFVGLHLALYATGILLPVKFLESLSFGFFTYVLYFFACYFHSNGLSNIGRFVGYSTFILFSTLLSSLCTYFNERGRFSLFELKRRQLMQQEKMAALGTLSAGLLHEVNNPVNYSMMALNMALREPETELNLMLKESLTDAKEGMERVQSIVTDLKTFAHQQPGEDQSQRIYLLEKAVQSALRLTGYELKGIEVTLDFPQDTHVLGDEPAIIGVLINLFSNAALALGKARPEQARIDIKARRESGRLHVQIRDNGSGIKPENLNRVFEPFFTTRDVGQGLGLGLSMSYSIIQRQGGALTVASEVGLWTEFSFDLTLAHQLD